MKKLVFLALILSSACADPPSRVSENIQYIHDKRTDLCFASHYGGVASGSFAMISVPCSDSILKLTDKEVK